MKSKLFVSSLIALVCVLLVGTGVLTVIGVSPLNALQTIASLIYILFLPGYVCTLVFFPISNIKGDTSSISLLERLALSVALSIALVPTIIFFLHLGGMPITQTTTLVSVAGIILVLALAASWRMTRHRTNSLHSRRY